MQAPVVVDLSPAGTHGGVLAGFFLIQKLALGEQKWYCLDMDRGGAIEVIKRFVDERLPQEQWFLEVQPELKAIIFYGSRAKETNRSDSDIDILLIVPLKTEEEYTEGEYVFQYEGWEINIVLRSIEKLRKLAEAGDDEFQREVFRGSEIIWQSDNEVKELLEKI